MQVGLSKSRANALVLAFDPDVIEQQLNWLPERPHVNNPGAYIETAIRGNFDPPGARPGRRAPVRDTAIDPQKYITGKVAFCPTCGARPCCCADLDSVDWSNPTALLHVATDSVSREQEVNPPIQGVHNLGESVQNSGDSFVPPTPPAPAPLEEKKRGQGTRPRTDTARPGHATIQPAQPAPEPVPALSSAEEEPGESSRAQRLVVDDPILAGHFTIFTEALMYEPDLSAAAKYTLLCLLQYHRRGGGVFPGRAELARVIQVTEKTLRGYLQELIDKKYLKIEKGFGSPSTYVVLYNTAPTNR